MKKIPRTRPLREYLKENERDPAYRAALERARLRVTIARAMKTARERAGLTQAELAAELELPQSVIGRLESALRAHSPVGATGRSPLPG